MNKLSLLLTGIVALAVTPTIPAHADGGISHWSVVDMFIQPWQPILHGPKDFHQQDIGFGVGIGGEAAGASNSAGDPLSGAGGTLLLDHTGRFWSEHLDPKDVSRYLEFGWRLQFRLPIGPDPVLVNDGDRGGAVQLTLEGVSMSSNKAGFLFGYSGDWQLDGHAFGMNVGNADINLEAGLALDRRDPDTARLLTVSVGAAHTGMLDNGSAGPSVAVKYRVMAEDEFATFEAGLKIPAGTEPKKFIKIEIDKKLLDMGQSSLRGILSGEFEESQQNTDEQGAGLAFDQSVGTAGAMIEWSFGG